MNDKEPTKLGELMANAKASPVGEIMAGSVVMTAENTNPPEEVVLASRLPDFSSYRGMADNKPKNTRPLKMAISDWLNGPAKMHPGVDPNFNLFRR